MRGKEVAKRYAKALFDTTKDADRQSQYFYELQIFSKILNEDKDINEFIHSVLITSEQKKIVIEKAVDSAGFSSEIKSFLKILAQRGRLDIFDIILESYQFFIDEANAVTRGYVRSSTALSVEQKKEIREKISLATNKKVILTYIEDPNIIGGLTAEAGGYRFDDTLTTHLIRLKEELKRRTH